MKFLTLTILILIHIYETFSYECQNIGSQTVFYDPLCSQGESLGCNAGGQGQVKLNFLAFYSLYALIN